MENGSFIFYHVILDPGIKRIGCVFKCSCIPFPFGLLDCNFEFFSLLRIFAVAVIMKIMINPKCVSFSPSRVFTHMLPLLTWLIFSIHKSAVVQAQSSCSTAQSIAAPFSFSESIVGTDNQSYYVDKCTSSVSDLPQGHWLVYKPSKSVIASISLDYLDSFTSPLEVIIFKGTCDSLTCVKDYFLQEQFLQTAPGDQYYILLYRHEGEYWDLPYLVVLEEYDAPVNDEMEGAIALTQDDVPYAGEYTLDGALSDFSEDACALDGSFGVWFTYTTTIPSEQVVLKATTGDNLSFGNVIGVQAWDGSSFTCVTTGSNTRKSVEWIADANVEYYILIGNFVPRIDGPLALIVQSLGSLQSPTAPANSEPAPSLPVSAPGPAPMETPPSIPNASNEGTSPAQSPVVTPGPSPTSETSRPGMTDGACFCIFLLCVIFV
ncbi:hypothetical protein FisN_18Lu297 [Fistulifera solaris]|uniref:Uncharacterized protein n=1 Tax=Fistulifera solaris TaxID=1519565 RepID=A0A1Z5JV29_FISSO|nr:hypothetical protein FisN_18Lu297 [Fistulifera solaris]|eukprot:GAX17628.1 hypothetical protein FisN_18Lu297 [Fistulifera solaris]